MSYIHHAPTFHSTCLIFTFLYINNGLNGLNDESHSSCSNTPLNMSFTFLYINNSLNGLNDELHSSCSNTPLNMSFTFLYINNSLNGLNDELHSSCSNNPLNMSFTFLYINNSLNGLNDELHSSRSNIPLNMSFTFLYINNSLNGLNDELHSSCSNTPLNMSFTFLYINNGLSDELHSSCSNTPLNMSTIHISLYQQWLQWPDSKVSTSRVGCTGIVLIILSLVTPLHATLKNGQTTAFQTDRGQQRTDGKLSILSVRGREIVSTVLGHTIACNIKEWTDLGFADPQRATEDQW